MKAFLNLKKKSVNFFFEKRGFKVFGGVALFPDRPLPVPTSIRYTTSIVEAGELIKIFLNGVDFYFRFRVMGV